MSRDARKEGDAEGFIELRVVCNVDWPDKEQLMSSKQKRTPLTSAGQRDMHAIV